MPTPYGKTFQPSGNGNTVDEQGRPRTPGGAPIQQAIRLISTRLPSVLGARALSPAALLNSAGGAGMSQGEIERLFRPQGPLAAPPMPPSQMMGTAVPPWLGAPQAIPGPSEAPAAQSMTAGAPLAAPAPSAPSPFGGFSPRPQPGTPHVVPGEETRTADVPTLTQAPSTPVDLPQAFEQDAPPAKDQTPIETAPTAPSLDLTQLLGPQPTISEPPDWLRRLLDQAPQPLDQYFSR